MNNKEFKPYVPAEKVTPEMTVTSVISGYDPRSCIRRSQCLSWSSRWYDRICFYSGSSYFHGCYTRDYGRKTPFWRATWFRPSVLQVSLLQQEQSSQCLPCSCGQKKALLKNRDL